MTPADIRKRADIFGDADEPFGERELLLALADVVEASARVDAFAEADSLCDQKTDIALRMEARGAMELMHEALARVEALSP